MDRAEQDSPREWRMHAGQGERGFRYFGDPRYVRMYGDDPVPVVLIEDPEGTYWGWMDYGTHWRAADDAPVMVQPHRGMFDMQFPYGPDAETERGRGEIVRCRVEADTALSDAIPPTESSTLVPESAP